LPGRLKPDAVFLGKRQTAANALFILGERKGEKNKKAHEEKGKKR